MFNLYSITVKNFMSVGNTTQAIDFNRNDLTLVLGENLDTGGGDAGSRNGVFINGKRVSRPKQMGTGDELKIGDSIFVLEMVEALIDDPSTVNVIGVPTPDTPWMFYVVGAVTLAAVVLGLSFALR